MIKKTLYCDRCGKECEQSRFSHYLLFKRKYILTVSNEEKLDLCQECYDSLQDWFQTGLNKVGKTCQESR